MVQLILNWAMQIGGVVAALCVLAFPMWALGIPGINDDKNDYVRGWKMGLVAIVLYPIAYLVFLATHYIVKSRTEVALQPQWAHKSNIVFLCLLLAFNARLIHSFYLVARNEKKHRDKEKAQQTVTTDKHAS
jgi:hypothetical protein